MKKLSQIYLELSQHTAALENRVEAASAEDRKAFEANRAEARSRVKALKDSFTAQLDEAEESFAEDWRALDEAFAEQMTRDQRRLDEYLNALDAANARAWAEDAEAHAEISAKFAQLVAGEAGAAMVEAKEARARADSLAKKPS
jgi:inorganic triphosphatase YgiF